MITNSEFVSRVANNLRTRSKDGHMSDRFILNIGRVKARLLMAQKLDELTLFKEDGIITTIPCFELERIDYKSCDIFEFRLCEDIMKSVNKIPEGLFGKNGSGIISVVSMDNSVRYNYITPNAYENLKKRKYSRSSTEYYTIKDGYLYLPNSTNEIVELRMIALDKKEAAEASSCKDCDCDSSWDYDFVCPDRFLDLVVKDSLQELASIFRTSVVDSNPNMDPNSKGKDTQ
jgi:hypothetical protein